MRRRDTRTTAILAVGVLALAGCAQGQGGGAAADEATFDGEGDVSGTLEVLGFGLNDEVAEVRAERVILATGRRPRTADLGLETLGISPNGGLEIDEHGRAGDRLWALGDVTGAMPFTHVAKHHARVIAANILGGDRRVSLRGVPRVVFSDPELAAAAPVEEEDETEADPADTTADAAPADSADADSADAATTDSQEEPRS